MKRIEDDINYLVEIPKSKRKRHKNTVSYDMPCLVNGNQVINQIRHQDNNNQKNRVAASKQLSIEAQIKVVNVPSNRIKHILSTPSIRAKARQQKALKRAEAIAKHKVLQCVENQKYIIL